MTRIVFMGSAEISEVCLRALCGSGGMSVDLVVTQPDRPRGRGREVLPTPVKRFAEGRGIPVITPEKINAPDVVGQLESLRPDVIAVVAYGQFVGRRVLALPRLGCVNVHPSLLPKYRGAAPIPWAIACGETETGVTTMQMCDRMDAGDILMQRVVGLTGEETAAGLYERLAAIGAEMLPETIQGLVEGRIIPRRQDESAVTFAPRLSKEDGRINWTLPADRIHNRIRGFYPWPGCFTTVPRSGRQGAGGHVPLKILKSRVETGSGEAGAVLSVEGPGPLVAAGEGALRILEVQPEGRPPMAADAYLRGYPAAVGERWGGDAAAGV